MLKRKTGKKNAKKNNPENERNESGNRLHANTVKYFGL
jgi:hypothetical protein